MIKKSMFLAFSLTSCVLNIGKGGSSIDPNVKTPPGDTDSPSEGDDHPDESPPVQVTPGPEYCPPWVGQLNFQTHSARGDVSIVEGGPLYLYVDAAAVLVLNTTSQAPSVPPPPMTGSIRLLRGDDGAEISKWIGYSDDRIAFWFPDGNALDSIPIQVQNTLGGTEIRYDSACGDSATLEVDLSMEGNCHQVLTWHVVLDDDNDLEFCSIGYVDRPLVEAEPQDTDLVRPP